MQHQIIQFFFCLTPKNEELGVLFLPCESKRWGKLVTVCFSLITSFHACEMMGFPLCQHFDFFCEVFFFEEAHSSTTYTSSLFTVLFQFQALQHFNQPAHSSHCGSSLSSQASCLPLMEYLTPQMYLNTCAHRSCSLLLIYLVLGCSLFNPKAQEQTQTNTAGHLAVDLKNVCLAVNKKGNFYILFFKSGPCFFLFFFH